MNSKIGESWKGEVTGRLYISISKRSIKNKSYSSVELYVTGGGLIKIDLFGIRALNKLSSDEFYKKENFTWFRAKTKMINIE